MEIKGGKLFSGQSIPPESTLVSPGERARLHYQGDGNLVVYLDGQPFWASHTDGQSAGRLTMRRDGNLVISDASGVGIASTQTINHPGAMVQLQDDGNFVIYEDPNGPLAGTPIWASATGEFVIGSVEGEAPGKVVKTRRPLIGPLRVESKLFRDDTGFRRVFFCSWFPALRVLRDNPSEFYRQLNAIAEAGYQGFRTFFVVGGWSPYWNGSEVVPVTFTKWNHSRESGLMRPASLAHTLDAWPDYDDLLRTLLRECRARGLRLHQATGDNQIIFPDAAGKTKELDFHRRVARICAEEGGLDVMALVADTNEYPQNRYASDAPESIEQMGRIIRVWEETIPGVLTTMGSAISEEPDKLYESITYGDVCAAHTSRGIPTALKRTHALIHWEGNYRQFPRPFWQGEPMGFGPEVSVDRFYYPQNVKSAVALYAMHALTGQASNLFCGPAIHARRPLEDEWGFYELPRLFEEHIPEDVATWPWQSNGQGGIAYWFKDKRFITATEDDWNTTPPRPVARWTLHQGDKTEQGTGTPPRKAGMITGEFV